MAKRDETGELIVKPTRPERAFPWRLWLYAILVTGLAGGAAFLAWTYRTKSLTADAETQVAVKDRTGCLGELASSKRSLEEQTKVGSDCQTALAAGTQKATGLETQLKQTSTNLSASKEELATLRTQRAEADKRLAAMEDIQKQFAKMIGAGQLKVSARRGSLVLSLPSEVLFASGSAEVSEKGQLAVLEIGITLKKLADRRFLVLGHTDDQPLKGSALQDNWALSTARALNVTRTLVKAGMDPKNLVPAGAGEHDPLGKDRARNRRIEIALLPAISELPPLPASLETPADAPKR
ncbi:MAG: OmpA family protein [Deltaproteobacteria bacterium]|nr:OmpA family protein [Deltaproteobacteria bacterium]